MDAANWRNPRLTIRADGIAVDSRVVSGQPRVVVPYDLPRVLVSLPIEAWPYGRVVALTDLGIREADGQDTPAIARNHTAALAVLDDLDVVAEWWP